MLRAILLPTFLFVCGTLSAQEPLKDQSIKVGDSITTATAVLRQRRIEFYAGGLALTKSNDDSAHMVCVLDENRTRIAMFYSKATSRIMSMSAIIVPDRQSGKSRETWIEAKSFTLAGDGSYSIHFLLSKPPPDRLPRSEYPGGKLAPK